MLESMWPWIFAVLAVTGIALWVALSGRKKN